jgi:hypothetical protein
MFLCLAILHFGRGRLRLTCASTAGYFEMMQTLARRLHYLGFFQATLHWHEIIAGIVLMAAVAMVRRAQAAAGPADPSGPPMTSPFSSLTSDLCLLIADI